MLLGLTRRCLSFSGSAAPVRGGHRHPSERAPSPVYGGVRGPPAGPCTPTSPSHQPPLPPRAATWQWLDPRLCRQSPLPSRLRYGPRSVSRLRPVPEHRPYLWAGAVPLTGPNFRTRHPDLLCTFLRAPVRPAAVNLQYCDPPPTSSLSRNNLESQKLHKSTFLRDWQIPSLNVTLRYFCRTFFV